MSVFSLPSPYRSALDIRQTQQAIKKVKDFFERKLHFSGAEGAYLNNAGNSFPGKINLCIFCRYLL